jgi:2-polyprenyl-3-methyl-5-hydroxy-6-metoxy-1,4-benzoquinol methylase
MNTSSQPGVAADKAPRPAFVTSTAEYWESRLSEKWGLEGVGNIGLGVAYNRWQYKQRKCVFLRELKRLPLPTKDASVLDVGSGVGFWLSVWTELGVKSLTGVDITGVAIQNLKKLYPDTRLLQLDISSPVAREVLPGTFDAVTAMDVLSHITSEACFASAIANISNSLRTGGYFVFSENLPHKEKDTNFNSIQANRTLEAVERELGRNGLRIVQRTPIFVVMMLPLDTATDLPRKLWRLMMTPVYFFPKLGGLFGAALYGVDSVLSRVVSEGPATELVICQKV